MDISNKKVLKIPLKVHLFEEIKSGARKSENLKYKRIWKEKLIYPCGTFKKYDFVLFQPEDRSNSPQILVEFKGVKIVKEKKSWLRTEKYFGIELGNVVGNSIPE